MRYLVARIHEIAGLYATAAFLTESDANDHAQHLLNRFGEASRKNVYLVIDTEACRVHPTPPEGPVDAFEEETTRG